MGSVWAAHHTTLNVPVAIKFINAGLASRPELRSRFAQEAQAAAMLDSSHVVRVLDHGTDEGGRPYIAMAMLQGQSLAERLRQEPVLPLDLVARIVTHTAMGLAKAHKRGIFHRDIKPENLFLTEDEDEGVVVKILDFGIAKSLTFTGGGHQTAAGLVMGTPHYMSPEQAMGTPVDHRCDLFSLGVVAYRCLTGTVPFEAEAIAALILAITSQPHDSLSTRRPDLGTSLDRWFETSLAKDPNHRYQDAKSQARAFGEICKSLDLGGDASSHTAFPLVSWSETTGTRGRAATTADRNPGSSTPAPPRPGPLAAVAATASGPTQEQGPTLQGASSANDEPPELPMRRSVLPFIVIGLLVVAGGVGGTTWWMTHGTSARRGGTPDLPPTETLSASSSVSPQTPTVATSVVQPRELAVMPDAAATPRAGRAPPARPARSTGSPTPPTVTQAPPASTGHDWKRGCTKDSQCKGNRVCVAGECQNR